MRNLSISLVLSIFSLCAYAQIPADRSSEIPYDAAIYPNGFFPIAYDVEIKGGYRTVEDIAERDATPRGRRSKGMLVYVRADGKTYRLGDLPATGVDNTQWTEVTFGGGGTATQIRIGNGAPGTTTTGNTGDFYIDATAIKLYGPKDATNGWPTTGTSIIAPGTNGQILATNGGNIGWATPSSGGGGGTVPSGPITTLPTVGTTITGAATTDDWIRATFYGSTPPTATLAISGGTTTFEVGATPDIQLDWTAAKTTDALQSVTIGGSGNLITAPQDNANGTYDINPDPTTDAPYTLTVKSGTGASEKTQTATASVVFRHRIYIGFVPAGVTTVGAVTDAHIKALGIKNFATSYLMGNTTIAHPAPGTLQHFVIAFPAAWGTSPNTKIGANSLAFNAANVTTRNFVNASGASESYYIMLSNDPTGASVADFNIPN